MSYSKSPRGPPRWAASGRTADAGNNGDASEPESACAFARWVRYDGHGRAVAPALRSGLMALGSGGHGDL
jgi:hypothetical protein